MAEIVGISVKFTGDNSDLKVKFSENKQALKEFEQYASKKMKIDLDTTEARKKLAELKTSTFEQKSKVTLDTAEARLQAQQLRNSMLEMREQKLKMSLDTAEAKSKMTEFQQFSNSMLGKITFGNLLASGVTMGMNVAAQAVKAFTQTLADSLKVASQYEIALKGLASVSQAFGQDSDKATAYARQLSSDGLIPLNKASETLKNLISTGYSLDEAFQLANALKNIAAFNNVVGDVGDAMVTSSRGFRINSIELIDNSGLTERLSSMLKKANVDISQGIALTESSTQRLAVKNAIMKEYLKFENDAAKLTETYAGKQAQANTAIKEAQESFGQFLDGPGKAFQDWVKLEADSLKTVLDYLKEIGVERDKAFTPAGYVEGKGGVSKLSTDELKEMQINAQEKIKNYLAEQAKTSLIPGVGGLFVGLNAIELEKTKKLLAEINAEIDKRNKLNVGADGWKGSADRTQAEQTALKANNAYFDELNKKIAEKAQRMRDYGSTQEEILKGELDLLKDEAKTAELGSTKYERLLKIIDNVNKSLGQIKIDDKTRKDLEQGIDITVKFNIDEEDKKKFDKDWKDVINLKKKINEIGSEWDLAPKIFGSEATGKEAIKVITDQINAAEQAMATLDTSTSEGQAQLQSIQQLIEGLKSKKIDIEVNIIRKTGTGGESGDFTSGYDPSKVGSISGGQNAADTTIQGIKDANDKDTENRKKYLDNLEDLGAKAIKAREELAQAKNDIGSRLTEIGDMLNDDFIKALGNVASNIVEIEKGLEQSKTSGVFGAVAGGLQVVSAAISIGQTIYNLINPAAEKQLTAAEKMEQAVNEYKASLEGKKIYQIDQSQKNMLSQTNALSNLLSSAISDPTKYRTKNWEAGSYDVYDFYDKENNIDISAWGYDNFLEKIKKNIEELALKFSEAQTKITESLNITWDNLAASVKSAFDEVDLSSFSENFEKSMKKSLRNAMVESFLQSELMSAMFTNLSDQMFGLLSSVNFDVSKLTEGYTGTYTSVRKDSSGDIITSQGVVSLDSIRKSISEATTVGESFYTLLEKLGLGVSDVSKKMTETASALSNVPSGIKLAYKRFEATTATQSTTPMINVYVGNEQLTSVVTRQQSTANSARYGSNYNSGVY